MTPSDTIRRMPAKRQPRPPSPRALVGQAVRDLLAYRGLTASKAGQMRDNCSTPTIRRILRGDDGVGDAPLQALAGILDLPVNIFLLMLDGDAKAIAAMNMPDYPQQYILNLLDTSGSNQRRRASDS